MKITLIIATLSCGGAERVLSNMANYWASRGRTVRILTFDDGGVAPFYDLHSSIELCPLNIASHSSNIFATIRKSLKRLKILRQAIIASDPDIVISFLTNENVYTLLATRFLGYPVVISERVDIRHHSEDLRWSIMRKLIYPAAETVVVQTSALRHWMEKTLRGVSVVTIPNPVVKEVGAKLKDTIVPNPYVLAVGRLINTQKGFDQLLAAFAELHNEYQDLKLVIAGEGPDKGALLNLSRELGIEDKVIMPGAIRNIGSLQENAALFVMSSLYEGFPNALCEAMASGVAVISYDCPSGPAEIIRDGIDGILVPVGDVDGLSKAMRNLMSNSSKRASMASRAAEIMDRFSAELIMDRWEALIRQAMERKRKAILRSGC